MSDIFICYSRKDLAIAELLAQRFESEGWNVFIDRQTHVDRRRHKEIERELHTTRSIVVLWSASSRNSDFVLEEAEYGKRSSILFPVFIERVEFPYGFSRIQTVDLINWYGNPAHAGCVKLLQSLRFHLNGHEAASTQPELRKSSSTPKSDTGFAKTYQIKLSKPATLKFILPIALIVLGFMILPVAEVIYEAINEPADSSVEANEKGLYRKYQVVGSSDNLSAGVQKVIEEK